MVSINQKDPWQRVQAVLRKLSCFLVNDAPGSWMDVGIAMEMVQILRHLPENQQQDLLTLFIRLSMAWAGQHAIPSVSEDMEAAILFIQMWLKDVDSYEAACAELQRETAAMQHEEAMGWGDPDDEDWDDNADDAEDASELEELFWDEVTIRVANCTMADEKLPRAISKEEVLAAIRATHHDREQYPFPEDVDLEAPIDECGVYYVSVRSNRGIEKLLLWVLPPLPKE